MKKLFISAILIISSYTIQAQVRFGFKTAPQLSYNRIQSANENFEFEQNGSSIKLFLGPTFDFPFRKNHYFSTGIFFSGKRVAFEATNTNNGANSNEVYGIQYLQIPLTLKLFTEEVGLDKKIYFQFGTTTDFRLQGILSPQNILQQVSFFDFSALLAAGLEYRLGIKTRLFAGVYYNRGFISVINEATVEEDWRLFNDTIGLELGVTF